MEPYFFSFLPSELNNIICYYLTYNESLVVSKLFKLKINYLPLLIEKYPAMYKIIKELKEKDLKYRDYPYSEAYDLMGLIELGIDYLDIKISNREFLYTDDVGILIDNFDEYAHAKIHAPVNQIIEEVVNAYNNFDETSGELDALSQLYQLFLIILDNP